MSDCTDKDTSFDKEIYKKLGGIITEHQHQPIEDFSDEALLTIVKLQRDLHEGGRYAGLYIYEAVIRLMEKSK